MIKKLVITIDDELYAKTKQYALKNYTTVESLAKSAILDFVKKEDDEKRKKRGKTNDQNDALS